MNLSQSRARLIDRLGRRKTRARDRAYVAEGVRCVAEVLAARAAIGFAVVSPRLHQVPGGDRLLEQLRVAGIDTPEVDDETLNRLAGTETPQGVVAVCSEPDVQLTSPARVLIADAIQDPGNLGTLIRSASAFDVDAIVTLDGTVDPYNAKVVRSSAGAVARLPILMRSWDAVQSLVADWGLPLLVAAAGDDAEAPRPSGTWALVVGNEARGVREPIRDAASASIAIPMPGGIDSLNAGIAGSILMYALTQPG
jgi:TrmH family RNA methyltransferase